MTDDNGGGLRTVAWKELFPWLNIFRVFRLSISLPALLFGAAGVLLTVTGWWLLGNAFAPDARLAPSAECPWKAVTDIVPNRPGLSGVPKQNDISKLENGGWHPTEPVIAPWQLLNQAAWTGLSDTGLPVATLAYVVLCGLWSVAVWAFFGAAICRIAAVQLAADEQVGMAAALRYACGNGRPISPRRCCRSAACCWRRFPFCLLGLIMRANVGAAAGRTASGRWSLVAGLLMTLLLLGVLFGWPLDVGHDQHRRDRQLRRPEPLLRLLVPAAAALPVLRGRGRRASAGSAGCWSKTSPPAWSGWAIGPPAGEAAARKHRRRSWAAATNSERPRLRRRRADPLLGRLREAAGRRLPVQLLLDRRRRPSTSCCAATWTPPKWTKSFSTPTPSEQTFGAAADQRPTGAGGHR